MNTILTGNEGRLCYQIMDKGLPETMLMIHGFMEDHSIWQNLLPGLKANIILVDLPGFGASIPDKGFDFSMKSQAKVIQLLLEHLQTTDIRVLGHSMGGYIALELATQLPQIKIGLLHSTCLADTEERRQNRNKTIGVLEKDASIFIREFYWNLFAENRKTEFSSEVEMLKQMATQIPVYHIIETVKALRDRKNHEETWTNLIHQPLLIGGVHDKLIDINDLRNIAAKKQALYFELNNSGHMGFYEDPNQVIASLNEWIKKSPN